MKTTSQFSLCGFQFSLCGFQFSLCGSLFSLCGSQFLFCGSLFSLCGSLFSLCGSLFSLCGFLFSVCGSLFSFYGSGLSLMTSVTARSHRRKFGSIKLNWEPQSVALKLMWKQGRALLKSVYQSLLKWSLFGCSPDLLLLFWCWLVSDE